MLLNLLTCGLLLVLVVLYVIKNLEREALKNAYFSIYASLERVTESNKTLIAANTKLLEIQDYQFDTIACIAMNKNTINPNRLACEAVEEVARMICAYRTQQGNTGLDQGHV